MQDVGYVLAAQKAKLVLRIVYLWCSLHKGFCLPLLRRWLYSVADDFFAKQLPHNVTWALTVLYALDAPGDFSSTAVQVVPHGL